MMMELIYRHIRYFVRDKSRVFFSLLSIFVLILLYKLFLGHSLVLELSTYITQSGEQVAAKDMALLTQMTDFWLVGGLLAVNCITLALGSFGVSITDRERNRIKDFLLTSCSQFKLYISYIISTIIITFIFTVILFVVAMLFFVDFAAFFNLGFMKTLLILLIILIGSIFSSFVIFPLVLVVANNQAFSILSTIFGTFSGFFTGTYMTISSLPAAMQYVVTWFPFTHFASFFRQILTSTDGATLIKDMGAKFNTEFDWSLGTKLYYGTSMNEIPLGISILYLAGWMVLAIVLIFVIANRKSRKIN
jgi:multidrug/hemolysin transport system permease protein